MERLLINANALGNSTMWQFMNVDLSTFITAKGQRFYNQQEDEYSYKNSFIGIQYSWESKVAVLFFNCILMRSSLIQQSIIKKEFTICIFF